MNELTELKGSILVREIIGGAITVFLIFSLCYGLLVVGG